LDGNGKIEYESEWEKEYALPIPCPFLGVDNLCTIYFTRPNICVFLQPGDDQCLMARGEKKEVAMKSPGQ